jgi:nitrite reductase (NO-forming)
VIDPAALRRRPSPIDRASDRLVALGAIGIAVAFLVAAVAVTFLPAAVRRGAWLPLHLALAGAASTAIAGIMPFFAAAFAAAPPIDARIRSTAVGAVALGATCVSLGVVGGQIGLAVGGGVGFVAGIVLTGIATIRPLGRGLGPSRGLVTRGYILALGQVAVGSSLATIFLAGWQPLVQGWAGARPAHAWLNLVGFASLVIATTLLHFFPTVVGARIASRPSARITVAGLGAGAPLVALGFAIGLDILARAGAACVAAGAAGLAMYAWHTWQTRARWTTDPGWHRFAMGGLVSAIAWFEVGIAAAAGRVLAFGADPGGWSIDAIVGPLVVGWIGLTVVASATHLVPAVGPGDPVAHAQQRQLLGRAATVRLLAANGGAAALSAGVPIRFDLLVVAGAVLAAVSLGATAVLLGAAVRVGVRRPSS